jgi:hypothetical protein
LSYRSTGTHATKENLHFCNALFVLKRHLLPFDKDCLHRRIVVNAKRCAGTLPIFADENNRWSRTYKVNCGILAETAV